MSSVAESMKEIGIAEGAIRKADLLFTNKQFKSLKQYETRNQLTPIPSCGGYEIF